MCQTKFLSRYAKVFCIFFFFKPVIYSGRRFEATTSAGYLLQTLAQALPRDRDLHFKCNPAKVYGRAVYR